MPLITKVMEPMPPAPLPNRFLFLDCMRALAAWLVIWDHVVADWPARYGHALPIVQLVRTYLTGPMGIIQDFGWLGVVIFFLISGFIITHVSEKEGSWEFFIKRVFRIFPMLILAIMISVVFGIQPHATWVDVVRNALLLNYFSVPQTHLVGVAWTLAIEVVFYALVLCTHGIANHTARVCVSLAVVALCITYCREFGAEFFLVSANVAYVPYLIIGQIVYLGVHRNAIPIGRALALLAISFALLVYGILKIHTVFLPLENSHLIGLMQAGLIFMIFLSVNARLKESRLIRFLSDTSFGVYLIHGTLGVVIFRTTIHWGPYPAILASALGSLAAATLLHHAVERPMMAFGRSIVRKRVAPGVISSSAAA